MGNILLSANTVTPRPPLNIFEAARKELQGSAWYEIAKVPQYYIPADGPDPARTVNAVAIMTGLTVTNMHTSSIRVSARIRSSDDTLYTVINSAPVPPNDFLIISFDRQVMMSGESFEVSVPSNGTSANHATVHFTYIVNQREEFTQLS